MCGKYRLLVHWRTLAFKEPANDGLNYSVSNLSHKIVFDFDELIEWRRDTLTPLLVAFEFMSKLASSFLFRTN